MNWYKIFYWITRADSVKGFFDTFSNIFSWLAVLTFLALIVCSVGAGVQVSSDGSKTDDEDKVTPDIRMWQKLRKYFSFIFYPCLGIALLTWFGYMATPTKKEALLILAGGGTMQFLATDSASKQIPHEMSTFVLTELKSMAKDAEVDLGLSTAKDKILDEAKKMTGDEMLNKMKLDSNFRKIVTTQ